MYSNVEAPATALTLPKIFTGLAAIITIIGSFSPWVSVTSVFGQINASGTQGDRVIALIAGVVMFLGLALTRRWRVVGQAVAGLAALTVFGVGAYDLVNVSSKVADYHNKYAAVSVGWGLWATLVGGVLALASLVFVVRAGRQDARREPEAVAAGVTGP